MLSRCGLALLALALPVLPLAAADKPNIVVLLADDLGYADLGFQGGKDIPTPHLDALAKAGVRCTNGYVSGPYCSPTRAGFLTGRYQNRFGHEFNPSGGGGEIGMPVTETTVADRLKAAGYATGLVGKWHLGGAEKFQPPSRGFDDFFGFLGGAHTYFAEKSMTIRRGKEAVVEKEYLTDALGREAVAFIDKNKAKPFFLYLAFNAVHTPMEANDARLKQFAGIADQKRRTYAAMLSAMDENVGKVLAKLRDEKLEEKTLIVFFSDNGGPTMQGTTINGSVNAPLRGSKRTTLEGGIRVPFVFTWKGTLPAGKVYDNPIIQLDLMPTFLAAADNAAKTDWKFDGVDLLPYLKGTNPGKPHETLYWRFGQQMAIRHGDWKLVKYDQAADGKPRGAGPYRLYDLSKDIGEATDLSEKEPERLKDLEARWTKWNADMVKPLWGGANQ